LGLALLALIVCIALIGSGRRFLGELVAVPISVAVTLTLYAQAEPWPAFAAAVVGLYFAGRVLWVLWMTGATR
jgi:hypothetical protein